MNFSELMKLSDSALITHADRSIPRVQQVVRRVTDGWMTPDRQVWGTYLHGLFDNDGFRWAFREELRKNRSVPETDPQELSYQTFQETQLDRLADLLRGHLDMAHIKRIIQPE